MKVLARRGKSEHDMGKILICAGEPSGDFHASNLVRKIFKRLPDVDIHGIGGNLMRDQGVDIIFDCKDLAVMGITDVISRGRVIFEAYSVVSSFLTENMPGLVILVDYPGFNLRVAEKASRLGIPVFYYISPKVWAWGSGRIDKIRRYVDHMGLILPFEEAFYRKKGIRATYVGNPLVDMMSESGHGLQINQCNDTGNHNQHKDDKRKKLIGLLPGSRTGEISRHLPVMLAAAYMIIKKIPDAGFILSIRENDIEKYQSAAVEYGLGEHLHIETGDVGKIFEKADLIVAASGTVTLEAAVAGVPTIIIYIMSEISFRIARTLVRVNYAGLANLIAGREISPELLQEDASPERISEKVLELLGNPESLEKMKADFRLVRKKLGKPGAAARAADIAVSMLGIRSMKNRQIKKSINI